MQSGVFRETFTNRESLGLFTEDDEFCERTKRISRQPVIIVKSLQKATENGMFGHQLGIRLLWCPRLVGF